MVKRSLLRNDCNSEASAGQCSVDTTVAAEDVLVDNQHIINILFNSLDNIEVV